jgi:hypothetical protein
MNSYISGRVFAYNPIYILEQLSHLKILQIEALTRLRDPAMALLHPDFEDMSAAAVRPWSYLNRSIGYLAHLFEKCLKSLSWAIVLSAAPTMNKAMADTILLFAKYAFVTAGVCLSTFIYTNCSALLGISGGLWIIYVAGLFYNTIRLHFRRNYDLWSRRWWVYEWVCEGGRLNPPGNTGQNIPLWNQAICF